MIKTKKQMYVVIGVFALVMLLGTVTYAFFNYTRTGLANTISTGQINFSTTQTSGQDGYINLTNVFPVDVTSGVPTNDPNVGEVTINVTGDTTYTGGIEYVVTAENVQNTIGSGNSAVTVPIGISVTATSGLGTSDDDYFTDVRNNPQTSIYKVLATDVIEEDEQLAVGYIKSGQDGVNGNITIKAYLDASKIAISDTYYENVTTTPTPTAPNDEYGTPASFGEGRTVLTTTQWNALQSGGVSFQVKVEANEGVWVTEPAHTPTMAEMCPGCVFSYSTKEFWTTWNTDGQTPTVLVISDYEENYEDVISSSGKNYFLGLKLNGSYQIEKVYSCGLYNNETPFCIEGYYDSSKYEANQEILQSEYLWNNTCEFDAEYGFLSCPPVGSLDAYADLDGIVTTETDDSNFCEVASNGRVKCYYW